MRDTTARDLVALSAIAFNQGDYETAGKLYTQAMSCPDSGDFLNDLLQDNVTCSVLAESLISDTETAGIDSISSSISDAIKNDVEATSNTDRKQSLRDDEEDFHDIAMQTFESNAANVKSPLSIKFKE